jgi:hypothetical protein
MELLSVYIHCSSLKAMYEFYRHQLGFDCGLTRDRLEVDAGKGRLVFTHKKNFKGGYHYAFAIDVLDMPQAFSFLRTRTSLFYSFDDDSYIANFRNWKAKSLFFSDPDGNVVEFIGRKEDSIPEAGIEDFSPARIIRPAEIGLGTTNSGALKMQLRREAALEPMLRGDEGFCPVGNPEGLFIVSSVQRCWFPTREQVRPLPVSAIFMNHGRKYRLTHDAERTEISPA